MKLYEYSRKQHPACFNVEQFDARSNPCLHCHLLIHKTLSAHILWFNFTCRSVAKYTTRSVWLVYISPSLSCHGDLCETTSSILHQRTETFHCNRCRYLLAPGCLPCPDPPHQGPSLVHPCRRVWGHLDQDWSRCSSQRYNFSQSCTWLFLHCH